MFTAINKEGAKVTASEAAYEGKQPYCCPKCGFRVNLRNGYVKIEHFAHNPGSSCEYAGESMLHLRMKQQIYLNLKELLGQQVKMIELEKYLDNCRPDIFIEGFKKKIAIEVQTSALTPEQIIFRTQLYRNNGIYVLWVLPYDEDRFTKYELHQDRRVYHPFKLKEYERIIMYLYFKTLIIWNIDRDYRKGFILLKLKDTYSAGTEFYDRNYGEHRTFSPKKLKTIKEVEEHRNSIQLSDLEPRNVSSFKMPQGNYDLPERNVLIYKWLKSL